MDRRTSASSAFWRFVDRLSRTPIGTILAVAVALRLVAGLAFPAGSTNGYEYAAIARHIVDGEGYTYFPATDDRMLPLSETDAASRWLPSAYMPPLYTYVTVAATTLGGDSHAGTVWALRGFNLLMGCVTVLAVYTLTRRLSGSDRAATLAALGCAIHPPFVYLATQVSGANLYVPVGLLLVIALLEAARSRAWSAWAGAGLVLGMLCLLRGEALVLVPLVAAWLLWVARTVGFDHRLVVLFVVVASVFPAGWMVRNWSALGRPLVAVTTSGGHNLWAGNHSGATGSQKGTTYPPELRQRLLDLPPDDDFELHRDYLLRETAFDYMRGEPGAALLGIFKKGALLVGADIYDRRSLNPIYLVGWALLLVWGTRGLAGWWRSGQTDRSQRVLIAGLLAFGAAIPIVFVVLPRYRLPIESLLLVFAGAWLASRSAATRRETAVTAG